MDNNRSGTTAGEALREMERPLSKFPNRAPWEHISEEDRYYYAMRAEGILETADAIRTKTTDLPNDPLARRRELEPRGVQCLEQEIKRLRDGIDTALGFYKVTHIHAALREVISGK